MGSGLPHCTLPDSFVCPKAAAETARARVATRNVLRMPFLLLLSAESRGRILLNPSQDVSVALQVPQGVLHAALALVEAGRVVVSVGIVRLQGRRVFVGLQRLVRPAQVLEGDTQIERR